MVGCVSWFIPIVDENSICAGSMENMVEIL